MIGAQQIRRWHIYPSVDEFEARAAHAIARAADQAIERAGRFVIVLAGGNTPCSVYARLAQARSDWSRWHFYFGDERCVPAGDRRRNDRMARDVWLDRVAIPPAQVHAIPAERGAVTAATRYAEIVQPVGRFDLVLLGLGEDGHTASLFSGRAATDGDVVAVHDAPKAPSERVSLSAARLAQTRQVMFLVSGERKRGVVARWRRGDPIPAAWVAPDAGVDVLLDAAAWPDSSG